ncbi:MAG: cellulase family glycosylhydrolase [Anaerolineales bacterium]|jgi:hypothetical protein
MIRIQGPWFKDEHGRTLMLRGVNLGGSSKVPAVPDGATYIRKGFFDHRQVSFVGRPFPLEQADEHFARLRAWGYDFLRFLVTWEAVEHAGPGIYDQAYLDYVHAIVEKAAAHGMSLFIDPHQDVWSRFTGGDGAPGWTLEAVGLDMQTFHETGAALTHQVHGDPFPRMIWPTNANKLAAATMFTLFFGGNQFAPQTKIEGEPVQAYLQRHYIQAIKQIAIRLSDLPNVIGYDTMNEPSAGYIGREDLHAASGRLLLGDSPTPFQSMLLASGVEQEVERWTITLLGPKLIGTRMVNTEGVSSWLPGFGCIWRQNGVWDFNADGTPHLLRPDHFASVEGQKIDFARDFYRPFANRYAAEIRSVHPQAIIFLESQAEHPQLVWDEQDASNVVYAPHWYDGFVLFTKRFTPWIAVDMLKGNVMVGPGRIRKSFAEQLGTLKRQAGAVLGGIPTLIGEFGIAFDLADKQAYRTGDFRTQTKAMDRSFRAIEDNLLSCTLWNYTADNTNRHGDQWNDEDLSVFSRDQQHDPKDIHSGGRALKAVIRPYARRTAGEPLSMRFDYKLKRFEFVFRHDPQVTEPTEIFVPRFVYPDGHLVKVSDGVTEFQPEEQLLLYRHAGDRQVHTIRLSPK